MARFATSLISFAFVLSLALGGQAGPACARKQKDVTSCMAACSSKWGWPGAAMGTDPWGAVIKPSDDDAQALLSQACGGSASTSSSSSSSSSANATTAPAIINAAPAPPAATTGLATEQAVGAVSKGVATISTSSSSTTTHSSSTHSSTHSSSSSKPATHNFAAPAPSTSSTPPPAPKTTKTSAPPPSSTKAPAPAPTETGSSGSSGGGSGTSSSDEQQYLSLHNSFRAQHGASDMTWNDNLASKAQEWANKCVFQHSGGTLGPFGENLAAGTGSSYDIASGIQSWTSESSQYNPSSPVASHFTQVVWKASTELGCASAECDGIFPSSFGKAMFIVCEYSAQGNVEGAFAQNVQL